jgi:hypothetical protein
MSMAIFNSFLDVYQMVIPKALLRARLEIRNEGSPGFRGEPSAVFTIEVRNKSGIYD